MSIPSHIRILRLTEGDRSVLDNVAPDVFDGPVNSELIAEFLGDNRHHIIVALDQDRVVGMATAVHYLHPDKNPELWINEVGVTSDHRGLGIGKALLAAMFEHGKMLGCKEGWVLTRVDNSAARRLYSSVGGREEENPVYYTFDLSDRNSEKA